MAPARDGTVSPAVRAAAEAGLFDLSDRTGLRTSTAPSDWWVPIVLVAFSDSTLKYNAADFTATLLDTTHSSATGSVSDYYQWATGGRVRFRGQVVATVILPRPESYYGNFSNGVSTSTPHNDYGLVVDAMIAADSAVDWNRFDRDGDGFVDMVWVLHAGLGGEGTQSRQNLWSITSRLSQGWGGGTSYETNDPVPNSTTRHVRVDRFSILPELSMFQPGSISEIGVFCHEFGHALGLPDLYDTSTLGGGTNMGPGNWSLMSSGVYGGDGHSPQYPVHMGGWALQFLGLQSLQRPSQDTLVVLSPLSRGGPLFDLSFQGESRLEHFILEARYKEGFDRNLPASGLLVTQVDDGVIGSRVISNQVISSLLPAYRVVEGDGDFDLTRGSNRGDGFDVLPGSDHVTRLDDDTSPWLRTFHGAPTNLSLDTILRAGSTTIAYLHVRAPGWLPIEDPTEAGFKPVGGAGHGRHALIDGYGAIVVAYGDLRTGVSQVRLRSRNSSGRWSVSEPVTASSMGAYDPAIAALPLGDVALAWTDVRGGTPQVFYSARLSGSWTPERQISPPGASGMAPAIAADAKGRVLLTWLDTSGPKAAIRFSTFGAATPGGPILTVSDSLDSPLSPSIAAIPNGRAWIAWSDHGSGEYLTYFAGYAPDSGLRPRLRLSNTTFPQPAVDVAADSTGTVYYAWQQVTSGVSEIHLQRRDPWAPLKPDTVLVASSQSLQDPTVGVDLLQGVHLAFTRSGGLGQQVQYVHAYAGRDWDSSPTDVSDPAQGSAGHLALLPYTHGTVTLLYTDDNGVSVHEHARARRLDPPLPLAVPPHVTLGPDFRIGPNPLLAGQELFATGAALTRAEAMDLFDAAGRRVGSARVNGGAARFSPSATRTLGAGLYFAQVRGGAAVRIVVLH